MRCLVLVFGLVLSACQTISAPPTPTGVTFRNAPTEKVKAAVVTEMLARGYRITRDSQFELAFDKASDNLGAQLLFGSRYDSIPSGRVTYTFVPQAPDVTVHVDLAIITNPGSSFEQRTQMNGSKDAQNAHALLEQIAQKMSSEPMIAGVTKPAKQSKR